MYYRNYGLQKTWLHESLKSPVSADSLTDNMINGPKHCFNLNYNPFTISINQR